MKQQIQIVDDDDNLIGYKERGDVDPANDIYRVASLWLTNSSGDVLIAQRKFTKETNPGRWGAAVSGTVEQNETYERNIYKEAEEEIGLAGITFQIGPKLRAYEPRNHFTQWYAAVVDRAADDFVLQEEEVEAVKWVSEADLVVDVQANPDHYVTRMSETMEILTKEIGKL